ncbi:MULTISPECIES: hypothetical protein [Streptomyces]|uniref:Integral membrane protein n=2 Tax=Streptomyces TaxID=1883 RepID=A0A0B5FAP5_STRA4|nr:MULTISPECIES: hypothetical protein [Streptomyces]AJE87542.1 hypothetical protein SLNWT_7166 [Streptomyces albus]AOU81845.1 hypothetical protein SLNHY_7154 [Streptomyces albus]AYN37531.1 hypothetical protein DUI70_7038 [Streptomyces albus]
MRTTRVLAAAAAVAAAVSFAAPAVAADPDAGKVVKEAESGKVVTEDEPGSGMSQEESGEALHDRGSGRVMAVPSVIARGGKLTVSVSDSKCNYGTRSVSSRAFQRTVNLRGSNPATAEAWIKHDARPGSYDITAMCNGKTIHSRDAFTVIGGPVQGGIGGSSKGGATGTDMAIGGGLVAAAALGGGAFWLRRRAENRV